MVNLSVMSVAIVCHDAGGAEIISCLSLRLKLKCKYALFGPAFPIFQRKIEGIANQTIGDALDGAELLVCGTSSPSTYELDAIALAHSRGIMSIAILDHWINFRERFLVANQLIIPSEIWVVDEAAEEIALKILPEASIRLIENPYREDFLEKLAVMQEESIDNSQNKNYQTILYVTEPTSEHAKRKYGDARYWGYTEQEAFKYFIDNIKVVTPNAVRVIVRPHPSEYLIKYDFALTAQGVEIVIRKDRDLLAEIAEADIVAGCNSMAMVAGTWAGRRVVCCIPPNGSGFNLSASNIEFLRDMTNPSN